MKNAQWMEFDEKQQAPELVSDATAALGAAAMRGGRACVACLARKRACRRRRGNARAEQRAACGMAVVPPRQQQWRRPPSRMCEASAQGVDAQARSKAAC